jgi:hypothetical protein
VRTLKLILSSRASRQIKERSLEDMEMQLYLSGKENIHVVLGLFFEMANELTLLKYLMPILKWSLLCLQLVNFSHSRNECRDMFVEKLLVGRTEKERQCFDRF